MSQKRRNPLPLTSKTLEELGLAYVARFATTRAKLEAYLARKLRERGWEGGDGGDRDDEGEGDGGADPRRYVAMIGEKFVAAGYVDDAAFARMKTGSLLRRGYGMRRVGAALQAAGVDQELMSACDPGEGAMRQAALALARRRRFGPFGRELPDRPTREKQIAAMLRAGHALDKARAIVDATDPAAIEDWAESASGDEPCDRP